MPGDRAATLNIAGFRKYISPIKAVLLHCSIEEQRRDLTLRRAWIGVHICPELRATSSAAL
jgi:hypothetical protein